MPDLKLRPVPDSLCPALRSSFNPYSLNVEVSGRVRPFHLRRLYARFKPFRTECIL